MAKLHSVILVGSSLPDDGWMLADAAKLAWAVADTERDKGETLFLAPIPLLEYQGSTDQGCILGFHNVPRLLVPLPDQSQIISNPDRLKHTFLTKVRRIAQKLAPGDVLFIAFSSHGRESDGGILVGDLETNTFITVKEMEHSLNFKPASARIVVWVSACHSGFWVSGTGWETFAASGRREENWSIPASTSVNFRGSRHMLASFATLGNQAGVQYPHPERDSSYFTEENPPLTNIPTSLPLPRLAEATLATLNTYPALHMLDQCPRASMTGRTLPFLIFSHSALEKLKVVHPEPSQNPTSSSLPSRTGAVPPYRLSELKNAFHSAAEAQRFPPTTSVIRVSNMINHAKFAVSDDVLAHLISYHESLRFLAGSMLLTGIWNAGQRDQVQIPARTTRMDYLELRMGTEAIPQLWTILETKDQFKKMGFTWKTTVVNAFIDTWIECGAPDYQIEEVMMARKDVKDWIKRFGEAQPELVCPSCPDHLLLTKEEYSKYFQLEQDLSNDQLTSPQTLSTCTSFNNLSKLKDVLVQPCSKDLVPSQTW